MKLVPPSRLKRKEMELQMTAMIDVVFQLLIFFMLATSFKALEGRLDATLPRSGAAEAPQLSEREMDLEMITIKLESAGDRVKIVLNDAPCDGFRELAGKLVQLRKVLSIPVVIDAKPDIKFQFVITALNVCAWANIEDVSFAAPVEAAGG